MSTGAYNIKFTITPELKVLNNQIIKEGNLAFIDKKERIQYFVAYTPDMFDENSKGERPKDYTVYFSFSRTENGSSVKNRKKFLWNSIG